MRLTIRRMAPPDLLAAALAAMLTALPSPAARAAETHADWQYTGKSGAARWGDLDPAYADCKLGRRQSPIDIRGVLKARLDPLRFDYRRRDARVFNDGHTIQASPDGSGADSALLLDGRRYHLVQFHFHMPGEERINGVAFPMSLHLVHRDDDGRLAVVAVLLRQGRKNAALRPLFDDLPARPGDRRLLLGGFDPAALLPARRVYFTYDGSLTTPPCTEGVRWFILRQPVDVSAAQLRAFKHLYPLNARPVQPLYGRKVQAGG